MQSVDEIDQWIDNLTPERVAVLERRIEKALEDVYDVDEQERIGNEIIHIMYTDDLIEGMVGKGLLQRSGVDENGEVMYALAE